MTTLPDYWLVYITMNEELDLPELTAIAPPTMHCREMAIDARKVLAAADVFHTANEHERIVFLADLTAWLHHDKGVEWHDLNVDIDKAVATLHEGGPSIVLAADPAAIAVAVRGRSDFRLFVPGQSTRGAEEFDAAVREEILEMLEAKWRFMIPAGG